MMDAYECIPFRMTKEGRDVGLRHCINRRHSVDVKAGPLLYCAPHPGQGDFSEGLGNAQALLLY